mgnify:CR=1 FL=1
MKHQKHESSLGLDANIATLIVWFGGTVISSIKSIGFLAVAVPFVIFFLEKKSPLVKQHALQAIALFIASSIASFVFLLIPLLWLFIWVIPLANFIISILAAIKGYNYEEYELPLIQPIVLWLKKIFNVD